MKFTVSGPHPERFNDWVVRHNKSGPKVTVALGDPPKDYTFDVGNVTKIAVHRAGDAVLYEFLQQIDDGLPAELLGEIAKAFPDLEFRATHGEFEIRNQQLSFKTDAGTAIQAGAHGEDPADDGVPPPSS